MTACRGYPDENARCTACGRDEDAHMGRDTTPDERSADLVSRWLNDPEPGRQTTCPVAASVTVEGVTESAWCQTPAGARHTMHTGTTPSGVIVAWTNEAERLTPPAREATPD